MIRGFYTSLAGLVAGARAQAVHADNLANVSTLGFKAARSVQSAFGIELARSHGGGLGRLATGAAPLGSAIDAVTGPVEPTGRPTDLALEGDGLFVVGTSAGPAYTRAGDFTLDATGTLTAVDGAPVLDVTGTPVRAAPGGALVVGPDGTVADTRQRIAIVAWPASGIRRVGENRYAIDAQPVPAAGVRVRQGALERSAVDLAGEMTDLIATQRAFGLNARALSLQEATLDATIQLGRIR